MATGKERLGIIGVGAMGSALLTGVLRQGLFAPDQVIINDLDANRSAQVAKGAKVRAASSNLDVVENADVLLLAVKPKDVGSVLGEIGQRLSARQLLLSIAAGINLAFIEGRVSSGVPVIRVMPNTPCLVGRGAIALSPGRSVDNDTLDLGRRIFAAVGKVVIVDEPLMDAVTGLSGSGPAFVYTVIEALSDGGVAAGLPRSIADQLAVETVLGAAVMVAETGEHPAKLRDMVTSPAGTTIAGMRVLEEGGIRSALIEAVLRATERSCQLGETQRRQP
ncbi:MAG: pyrroline-5-carboxylate reductase [Limnochordia bacterium]|jgi:pyrroline-5-carboxylate reductase